jgi:hypothetical protein
MDSKGNNTFEIECARFMNENELKEFYSGIGGKFNLQKRTSSKVLSINQNALLAEYDKYEAESIKKYEAAYVALMNKKQAWDIKVCRGCQGKIRLVNSEYNNFWGCEYYYNRSIIHDTFNIDYDEQFVEYYQNTKVRIDSNWLTKIIRDLNLQASVKASNLLVFYDALGKEDLRSKYGYLSTSQSISGFVKAKSASRIEEQEVEKRLAGIFPNCKSQLGIRYKLKGEKERVVILDMVIADDNEVFILEIKRNVHDIDEDKICLYYKLVAHILLKMNDIRKCYAVFLVFNSPDFKPYLTSPPHILWETVRNLVHKNIILEVFRQQAYYR